MGWKIDNFTNTNISLILMIRGIYGLYEIGA